MIDLQLEVRSEGLPFLYLTFPRPDGVFAVLALRDGAEPEIVSDTSAGWMKTRSR